MTMRIKDLSIKKKMFIVSLTYVVLTGAIIILGLTYISSTIKASDTVYEETVLELQGLLELKIDLEDTRRLLLTLMSESRRAQQEELLIKIDESESSIEKHLSIMLSPESHFDVEARPLLNKFRSIWYEFRDTREKELISSILKGEDSRVRKTIHGIQEPRFQTLLSIITDLVEHEKAETLTAHTAMRGYFRKTLTYFILFAAAGLLLVVLMYAYISKPIGIRLKKIVDRMKDVKNDNFDLKLDIDKQDEIGLLAENFNLMLKHLHEDQILREQYMAMIQSKSDEVAEKNRMLQESLIEVEKKNKEIEESRLQMVQSDKMASIGILAAGIAHEINNPIGFVKSNLNTLSQYSHDTKELLEILGKTDSLRTIKSFIDDKDFGFVTTDMLQLVSESMEGVDRIASIVRGLKEFSHMGEDKFVKYNLNECLDNVLKVGWNEIKYRAEIVKEYGNLPLIECYPQQLHQVFLNIIINAAHAIKDKGKIVLSTYIEGITAVVVIKDNGSGMDKETQKKIFDPFFTTKPVGQGTGLGLYIVYKIIKTHNGTIDVESSPDEGTTIVIKIPINRKDGDWWALAELNCGHEAFQASALPTELRAHGIYAENRPSAASGQKI